MRYTLAIRLAFICLVITACNQRQGSITPEAVVMEGEPILGALRWLRETSATLVFLTVKQASRL